MKKLPLGIQSFKKIKEKELLYIDKTRYINMLLNDSAYTYTFLSRPRRFGKSLFVDTLYHLFNGDKELFKGLYIYDKWDWDKKYPIIRLNFSDGKYSTLNEIDISIKSLLLEVLEKNNIKFNFSNNLNFDLSYVIKTLFKHHQKKVVILIDEYDNPILSNLEKSSKNLNIIREKFSEFFKAIKANEEYIEFTFITGISKVSQVNIFSGLNNLTDISLKPEFGAICGYTQKDIETTLMPYLDGVNLNILKHYYNGYWFLGEDKVYNPYDILLFIHNDKKFQPFWMNTGNNSLVIKLLPKILENKKNIPSLNNIKKLREEITFFDIDNPNLEALLFQAGYLTIKEINYQENLDEFNNIDIKEEFILSTPNREVDLSLNRLLTKFINQNIEFTNNNAIKYLKEANINQFIIHMKSILVTNPYNNTIHIDISHLEGVYAGLFVAYLRGCGIGVNILNELATANGRVDLMIGADENIYIIEFKTSKNKENAIKQILEKEYYNLYLDSGKQIHLVGIVFDIDKRTIDLDKCEFGLLDEFLDIKIEDDNFGGKRRWNNKNEGKE